MMYVAIYFFGGGGGCLQEKLLKSRNRAEK